jgi:hypothetical protein
LKGFAADLMTAYTQAIRGRPLDDRVTDPQEQPSTPTKASAAPVRPNQPRASATPLMWVEITL